MEEEKRKPENDEEVQEGRHRAKTREVRRLLEAPRPGSLAWRPVTPTRFVASRGGSRYTVFLGEGQGWTAAELRDGRPRFIARGVASLGEAQRAVEAHRTRETMWQAVHGRGNPITTVMADSEDEAREKVRHELNKNPSRRAFLKKWEDDGEQVRVKESRTRARGPVKHDYRANLDAGQQVDLYPGAMRSLEILRVHAAGQGLHVIKYPSGSFGYAGSVPVDIAFVDGATPEEIENAAKFGGAFGPRPRKFASREDAINYAEERGYVVMETARRTRETAMNVYSFGAGKGIEAGDLERFTWWLREYHYGYVPTEADLLGEATWQQLFQKYAGEVGPNFRAKHASVLGAHRAYEKRVPRRAEGSRWHQHKIAVDTVKNPLKGFLGGPTAEEAEEILRVNFQYTDAEIQRLKAARLTESWQDAVEAAKRNQPHTREVTVGGTMVYTGGPIESPTDTSKWAYLLGGDWIDADPASPPPAGTTLTRLEKSLDGRWYTVPSTFVSEALTTTGQELWDFMVAQADPWADLMFTEYTVADWAQFVHGFRGQIPFEKMPQDVSTASADEIAQALYGYAQDLKQTAGVSEGSRQRKIVPQATQEAGQYVTVSDMTVYEWLDLVGGGHPGVGTGKAFLGWLEREKQIDLHSPREHGHWDDLYNEFEGPWSALASQRLFDTPLKSNALLAAAVAVTDELLAELGGPFVVFKEQEIAKGKERGCPTVTVQSQTGEVFRLSLQEGRLHVDDVHETRGYDAVKKDGTVLETLPGRSMTAARQEVGRSLRDERRDEYYDWEKDGSRVVPSSEPTLEEAFSWAGEITDLAVADREGGVGIIKDEMVNALGDLAESLLKGDD